MRKLLIVIVCLVALLTACAPVKVESALSPIPVYYAGADNSALGVRAAP